MSRLSLIKPSILLVVACSFFAAACTDEDPALPVCETSIGRVTGQLHVRFEYDPNADNYLECYRYGCTDSEEIVELVEDGPDRYAFSMIEHPEVTFVIVAPRDMDDFVPDFPDRMQWRYDGHATIPQMYEQLVLRDLDGELVFIYDSSNRSDWYPEIAIEEVPATCRYADARCGVCRMRPVTFRADDQTLTLAAGQTGLLLVDGSPFRVAVTASYTCENNGDCEDRVSGFLEWYLYRLPEE